MPVWDHNGRGERPGPAIIDHRRADLRAVKTNADGCTRFTRAVKRWTVIVSGFVDIERAGSARHVIDQLGNDRGRRREAIDGNTPAV
ncbi:hypothetical protein D3C72_1730040 [compost metagenome]